MAQRVQSQAPERKEAQAAGFKPKSALRGSRRSTSYGAHFSHWLAAGNDNLKRRSNCQVIRPRWTTHRVAQLKGHGPVVLLLVGGGHVAYL